MMNNAEVSAEMDAIMLGSRQRAVPPPEVLEAMEKQPEYASVIADAWMVRTGIIHPSTYVAPEPKPKRWWEFWK
jgi:hypothetical protein